MLYRERVITTYEHIRQPFASYGLAVPNVVVETRSITVLKCLVGRSGFLSWMATPMHDAERQARVIRLSKVDQADRRRAAIGPWPPTARATCWAATRTSFGLVALLPRLAIDPDQSGPGRPGIDRNVRCKKV